MSMPSLHALLSVVGFVCLGVAAGYAVLTRRCRARLAHADSGANTVRARCRPVTVLKPLCGAEPGLYEHLRSFCQQDYPEFQIVFGVRDPSDPALAVVTPVAAEFPSLPIDVVINPQQHGSNLQDQQLDQHARPYARHDVLGHGGQRHVRRARLSRHRDGAAAGSGVGLVTCIYRGVPTSADLVAARRHVHQ